MNKQTARLLEQHFDTAFAAPDGIKKLRELILTLAMQGRLVPQDPDDPPASELVKEIEVEKRRLVKEGKIKTPKALPEIKADEVPYELPEGWVWVRLHDVFDVRDGTHDTPKYIEEGYPLITSKNLYTGKLSFDDVKFISEADHKKICERSAVAVGDILLAMIGSIGNPVIVDSNVDFSIKNVALFKFYVDRKPDNRFFYYFLSLSQNKMKAISSGAVQSFVSLGFLRNYVFPLPPLSEQHRIVAKIDQLMARCDELEALRAEHDQKRLAVHTSAITRLLDAQEKNSFDEAWQFITRHFDPLYSVKENVTELRKTILQLSMKGKLSSPLATDMPITSLIQKLKIEQEINPSIKKKEKDSIFNKLNEALNNVMNNRVDLEAMAFCGFITKGTTPSANELTTSGDIPFIKVYNIINNKLNFNYKPSFVPLNVHRSKLKRSVLFPGDVIMNIVGPPLGKVAIINDQYSEWNMNQALAVFRPLAGIYNRYIYYALTTGSVLESVLRDVKGTAGQDNLSLEQCRTIVIPIPSIEEQHRIVAKIDQLMALCDDLEHQIDATTGKQTELLNALMAQV